MSIVFKKGGKVVPPPKPKTKPGQVIITKAKDVKLSTGSGVVNDERCSDCGMRRVVSWMVDVCIDPSCEGTWEKVGV